MLIPFRLLPQAWLSVGEGASKAVEILYTDTVDNLLYIGGAFTHLDSIETNGIGYWDGESFHSMQAGQDGCLNSNCSGISLIIRYRDEIYTHALYPSIGGVPVSGIAKWDGEQWSPLGEGLKTFDSFGTGVAGSFSIWNDDLYVVGYFDMAGQDTTFNVARWDGQTWHGVGFPPQVPGEFTLLHCSAVYNDELYVGGNILRFPNGQEYQDIMKFDGTEWHQVAGGIKGNISDLSSMIVYKDELYVAGLFYEYDGNAGTAIMKLQGDTWSDVGGSFDLGFGNPIVSSMMVWDDKLYVFGIFNYVGGGVRADNVAIWDGEQWYGTNGVFDNKVRSGAVYDGHLIVGGGFDSIGQEAFRKIAQWDCEDLLPDCFATDVEEDIGEAFSLFSLTPNPTTSYLDISMQNIPAPATLAAHNLLGQPVWQSTILPSGGEMKETVDVSTWPPGVYFLTLTAGGQSCSQKVVVQ